MISIGIIAEIYCAFESSQMAFTYSKVNHGNTSTVKKVSSKKKIKNQNDVLVTFWLSYCCLPIPLKMAKEKTVFSFLNLFLYW